MFASAPGQLFLLSVFVDDLDDPAQIGLLEEADAASHVLRDGRPRGKGAPSGGARFRAGVPGSLVGVAPP